MSAARAPAATTTTHTRGSPAAAPPPRLSWSAGPRLRHRQLRVSRGAADDDDDDRCSTPSACALSLSFTSSARALSRDGDGDGGDGEDDEESEAARAHTHTLVLPLCPSLSTWLTRSLAQLLLLLLRPSAPSFARTNERTRAVPRRSLSLSLSLCPLQPRLFSAPSLRLLLLLPALSRLARVAHTESSLSFLPCALAAAAAAAARLSLNTHTHTRQRTSLSLARSLSPSLLSPDRATAAVLPAAVSSSRASAAPPLPHTHGEPAASVYTWIGVELCRGARGARCIYMYMWAMWLCAYVCRQKPASPRGRDLRSVPRPVARMGYSTTSWSSRGGATSRLG